MTRKEEKEVTKQRKLAACVKCFIQNGYDNTTLSAIVKTAGVSFSSFQNIFKTKDGVLLELTQIMFDSQFKTAKSFGNQNLKPVLIYAMETAIQLTITELNENIREVYIAAYRNPMSAEYIYQSTSSEIEKIFSQYNPLYTSSDFYEFDVGSSGIMLAYMSKKCNQYFTLEKKLTKFLTMTLRLYNVPNEEIKQAIAFVLDSNIKEIANKILHSLFESLAVKFRIM